MSISSKVVSDENVYNAPHIGDEVDECSPFRKLEDCESQSSSSQTRMASLPQADGAIQITNPSLLTEKSLLEVGDCHKQKKILVKPSQQQQHSHEQIEMEEQIKMSFPLDQILSESVVNNNLSNSQSQNNNKNNHANNNSHESESKIKLNQRKSTGNSSSIYRSSESSLQHQTGEKICGQKVLEDEYFCEDQKNKKNKRKLLINPVYFYKLRDHNTEWSFRVLAEFLFYHILFYFVLGPFVNILLFNKRKLFYNFSFWGNQMYFYIQTAIFAMNFIALFLFFQYPHPNIYAVELVYMQIGIFLRIFVISCKYASLPTEKLTMYREFIVAMEVAENDYYFRKWVFQEHSTIYREIYNAMQRGDFDPQMFYLRFFVDPCAERTSDIHNEVSALSTYHKYENEAFQPNCIFQSTRDEDENDSDDRDEIEKQQQQQKQEQQHIAPAKRIHRRTKSEVFYGYGIASLLLRKYARSNGNLALLIVSVVFAIFRGLLTFQYRLINQIDMDFSSVEVVQVILAAIIICYGYFSSFVFMIFFIRDLKMKYFLQHQCKLILQFRKNNVDDMKFLPTIDFTDPYSLKGWSILRRVLLDYGKSFFMRLQAFLKIYLFVALVNLAILIAQVYKLLEVRGEIVIVCAFESFVMLTALLYMLYRGSLINVQFRKFKNSLVDYKVLISDFIRLKKIYFSEKAVTITSMLRRHAVNRIKSRVKKAVREANAEVEGTPSEISAAIDAHLEEMLKSIEECDLEVDQDDICQPFTLLSIKITEPMFKSILMAIGTIICAVIQQMMNKMMTESSFFNSDNQW